MTAMPTLHRRGDYVSAVAVELGDLAPDDRAELIEELDDHIAALLEDRPETDLVVALGTPRAYAAELRTAAGLTGGATARPPLRTRLPALARRVDARVPDRARPYLAGLRPVWWVLRGYLLVAFACRMLGYGWASNGLGALVPAPFGMWLPGLLLALLAAAASVRLGHWRPTTTTRKVAIIALDVLALAGALVLAGSARYESFAGTPYYDTQYLPNCPIELDNLYAYDASGRAVDHVRLFDQNGTPFDLSVFGCNASGQYAPDGTVNAYPWPSASSGAEEPTGPPTSLAPLPGATLAPSTSATPTPSATPTS